MATQQESDNRYYQDHDLVVFVGHSRDARDEAEAIKSLIDQIQGELNRLNHIAGPSSRFNVVKIFTWEYCALPEVGGQERTITPHLNRSNIAVFVFRERVGQVTWQELTECRQRDAANKIPLIALFPNKCPAPERMTDRVVAEGWLDLLKKKEELSTEWTKQDSRSVLPTDSYRDHQDLKRIVLEKIAAVLCDLLRYVRPRKEKPSLPAELPLPAIDTPFIDQLTPVLDYDPEAVRSYRAQLKDEAKSEFPDSLLDADFLVKAGYKDNRGFLTRAGVLLFSNNPQGLMASAMSRYIVYEGVTKDSARAPQDIRGPIHSQILKVFELVLQRTEKRELPVRGSVAARTFYQYPVTCLREIIANALVHRKYDDTDRMIHIRAFSDRIEVVSPGSWSAGKKLSEIPIGLSKLEGESVKRNFRLVQAVGAIKLVEGEGSGIPTGLRDCSESDAPEPTVAEKDGCVVVTVFPRHDWSQFVKRVALEAEGAGRSPTTLEHRIAIGRQNVFISATSADLGSYRQVAKEAVLTLGAHPIEGENFPTDYCEFQALLARRLDPCDVIIHLVGFYYGGEPKAPPDTPRRSWTQWEYYRATQGERHKPVYRFLARENCHFDAQPTEDAEKQRLQREHREHLKRPGGPLYYEFSTPEELRDLILSIDELRELVRPRRARIPFLPMREKFIGRRQFLETLQQDLTAGTALVVAQPISVYADGGVGKTALAVELGWRLFEARQFDFVLFLNASTPETLDAELASLCASDTLDLPEQTAKEQETRRAGAMRWLNTVENGRLTLLIFDNADSDQARRAVRELLPKVATCAVLITSRFSGNLSGVRRQELALFDTEESREYLRTHLQPGLLAKARDQAVLDAVAEEVDHLPLALELVVNYMHETYQSAEEWLEEWHKNPDPTIKHYDSDNANYPVSLARVWEQSVGHLSHSARELLHRLVWMAPRPAGLPLEAFKTSGDWLSLRAALSELAKASLIGWPPAADEISVHRVLQAVTRNHLSEQEKTASLDGALTTIQSTLPSPEWDQKGWRLWEQLAPHCRTLLNHLRGHVLEPKATRIMHELARWLKNRADHGEAEPLYRRALAITEKSFGPEHPNVATSLNNLAELYRVQGRYTEAEPLYKRALAICEEALGPDHPNVATSLNNLAELYRAQGHYAKSEVLYERALTIWERALGPNHPDLAWSLNGLAALYADQGHYAKAKSLYERALAIREKALGPEHADLAWSLVDLANLYKEQSQHAKAEPLYERSLAILKKALGPEHPDVAKSLNNLAELYRAQGQYAKAEPLYERSLAILEKALGPEHPDVAASLNNLAELYTTQGQYAKAEPLHQRALAIREKSLGREHPDVAPSLDILATLYEKLGQYTKAEPLYERALAILEKALGPEHPDVATILNNLAGLYKIQGQYAKAEPLYQRALAIYEKALGPEHARVATSLNNLAGLYYTKGQYAKAKPFYERALAVAEKTLGPEHPDVATCLEAYTHCLRAMDRPEEAAPLEARARRIRD